MLPRTDTAWHMQTAHEVLRQRSTLSGTSTTQKHTRQLISDNDVK